MCPNLPNENPAENKVSHCSICKSDFVDSKADMMLREKLSPIVAGKKYSLGVPDICPTCRRQRRLAWRNTASLYRRKCDYSGKMIFSFYTDQVVHPVYDLAVWNSDVWDPMVYGRDFDFTRPFFEQFLELKNVVPEPSKSVLGDENSDYSNNASYIKNCYLCFNGGSAEDCYYDVFFFETKNCIDCYGINWTENSYECIDITHGHTLFFCQNSKDCSRSWFLKNCTNCEFCFACKNLSGKKYHILNKPYTREEYEKEIAKLRGSKTLRELQKEFEEFSGSLPEKCIHSTQSEDISGDYIDESKDIYASFDVADSENIRYCTSIKDRASSLMDVDIFGWGLSHSYDSVVIGHESSGVYFSYDCWEQVNNLFYCNACQRNVRNCFACIGLHDRKEYCILNKQYTKEEYEALVPKIIEHMQETGEWGKFFPPALSSYGYNETEGGYNDPMSREEALKRGFNWSDYEPPFPKVEKIIPADKLPDDITKIPDDILNWAIECEVTQKPFRIIKQELEFYRKHNLPIPRRHPDQRHLDRMALRNPRKLFERKCDKCGKEMITTYSPERQEKVYCEECYNREVVG